MANLIRFSHILTYQQLINRKMNYFCHYPLTKVLFVSIFVYVIERMALNEKQLTKEITMLIYDPKKNTLTSKYHYRTKNFLDMGISVDDTITEWVKKPGNMWSAGGDYIKEFKFTKKQFIVVHELGSKRFKLDEIDVIVRFPGCGKHPIRMNGTSYVAKVLQK